MAGASSGNGTIKGRLTIDGQPVLQHDRLKIVTARSYRRLPMRPFAERGADWAMWSRPERLEEDIVDAQCTSDDTSWSAPQKVAYS